MRYRHLSEINTGGQARIFLADDVVNNEKVVIKIPRHSGPACLRRFEREVRILNEQLDNPFIIDIKDYDLQHTPPFMVLEHCAGGSLKSWIVNRPPLLHVVRAMQHVILGLDRIHTRGGFHRDINPSNIGVVLNSDSSSTIKLIDFGLSQTPNPVSGTMSRSFAGTPGYIAPEIEAGEDYSWQADIWSLGVTFREIMTGYKNKGQFLSRSIPAAISNLLDKMTQLAPAMRPNATQIYQELDQYLKSIEQTKAAPQPRKRDDIWWALGALATGILARSNKWDSNVGRYRNSRGQFSSGWLS